MLITVFLTFGLTVSLQSLLAAWQAPGSVPPAGNVNPPIYNETPGDPATTAVIGVPTGFSSNVTVTGSINSSGNITTTGDLQSNNLIASGNITSTGDLQSNNISVGGELKLTNTTSPCNTTR